MNSVRVIRCLDRICRKRR